MWVWPVGHLGGRRDDLQADRRRAGEGDRLHARVAHERRADVAGAVDDADRPGRYAARAQRLDDCGTTGRRLLGGLQHRGVAGHERRGRASRRGSRAGSSRARSRRTRRGAPSGACCARRGRSSIVARARLRLARVVLEIVDRLGDVGVGLAPRLRALAHRQRRQLAATGAKLALRPRAAPRPARRARARPSWVRRRRRRRPRGRRRRCGDGARARRRDRGRRDRSRRAPRPPAALLPISSPTRSGSRASSSAPARQQRLADLRAAQLEQRLVGERLLGAGSLMAPPAAPRAGGHRPAGAGSHRLRCSRAGAGRGRPCPRRGRRRGSRRAPGSRAGERRSSSSPRP